MDKKTKQAHEAYLKVREALAQDKLEMTKVAARTAGITEELGQWGELILTLVCILTAELEMVSKLLEQTVEDIAKAKDVKS